MNTTDIVEQHLQGAIGKVVFESVHHHWYYTLGEDTLGKIHRVLEWQVWEDTDQIGHRRGDTLKGRAPGQLEVFLQELGVHGAQL